MVRIQVKLRSQVEAEFAGLTSAPISIVVPGRTHPTGIVVPDIELALAEGGIVVHMSFIVVILKTNGEEGGQEVNQGNASRTANTEPFGPPARNETKTLHASPKSSPHAGHVSPLCPVISQPHVGHSPRAIALSRSPL